MLRAIGMHRRSIMRMMLTEAAALGAVGGVLGMILGAAANIPLVARGIDYSKWIRDYDLGYRVSGVFYGSWQLDTIIGAFIIAVILSLVTALYTGTADIAAPFNYRLFAGIIVCEYLYRLLPFGIYLEIYRGACSLR